MYVLQYRYQVHTDSVQLIKFTVNPNEAIFSAACCAESLLSKFRGTETLAMTNTKGDFDPLHWVATIDRVKNAI